MAKKVGKKLGKTVKKETDNLAMLKDAISKSTDDMVYFSGDRLVNLVSENGSLGKQEPVKFILNKIGSFKGLCYWFNKSDINKFLECLESV